MPTIEEQHLVLNNLKDNVYYVSITENTFYTRYYLYAELVIPIETLYVSSNAGTKNINIYFLRDDIFSSGDTDITDSTLQSNSISYLTLQTDITSTLQVKYNYTFKRNNKDDYIISAVNLPTDIENLAKYKDYLVLSIMITPKLNQFYISSVGSYGNGEIIASMMVMINGKQICFSYDNIEVAAVPVDRLYNKIDYRPIIAINESGTDSTAIKETDYIIFNTDINTMMYPEVAWMFYGLGQAQETIYKNILVTDPKKDVINTCPIVIYPRVPGGGATISGEEMNIVNFPYVLFGFNPDLTASSNYPYCIFYSEITITDISMVDTIEDLGTGNFQVTIGQIINPWSNIFDANYRYIYRDDMMIEDKEFDETEVTVTGKSPNYKNIDVIQDVTFRFKAPPGDAEVLILTVYILVTAAEKFDLHYGYAFSTMDQAEQVELQEDNKIENIELYPDPNYYYYSPFLYANTYFGYPGKTQYTINLGEAPYRTKPKDIDIDEFLYRSSNNSHWKSLWKYNRTIEYSSPLQDNPVILPLNVFTDDENENMFVEFIVNSGSDDHFGIDLFDTCNIEQDGSDINITPSGKLFPNNGISNVYENGVVKLNIVSNNASAHFSQDAQGTTYPVSICVYYNSTTKKLITKRSDETNAKEITEISKDVLRNISCHIPGTGSITINFGPTSDYFQDYIDEILDQDNREDEVDISSDAEVDGIPSYTFETYPYSQATYNVVITIKPPFIAPEDAAKINESDYLTFSNSNLASYQYSYGVYNTDSMTLGYTLVFNRTHVPESTTEDVKKNNTDIIQISSSDGKYKYKITLKTIDILKAGYFRFTSFDVPHTNLADLGEAAGQHSFNAIYNLYFESNISKYFITTDTSRWDEIISNTTIKAIGETSSSEATIIKNIEMKIEYVDTDRYINGRIEFKVNSQDMDFDQFNFRFTATYKLEELGIETTVTSPVITINGSGGTVTPEPGSYMFAAIPSGLKITDEDLYNNFDEIEEQSFTTFIEHTYDSNSSVIYISNNDEYVMNDCKAGLLTLAMGSTRSTITFTLEDPSYMDTIITNYEEIFNVRNTGIGLKGKDSSSTKYLIYSYSNDYNTLSINKISDNKFTLTLKCNYLVPSQSSTSFVKGENYTFISYTTIAYSNISVNNNELFLSLMRSPCTTKLEFTIIGINDD